MAHFNVLVIGDNLEQKLAPFCEFQGDGNDDPEYIQNIDILESTFKDYQSETITKIAGPDGSLFDTDDEQFYRDPTDQELSMIKSRDITPDFAYYITDWNDGKGVRPKIRYMPEGFALVKTKIEKVYTFSEYLEYYYDFHPLKENEIPDTDNLHALGWYRLNDQNEVTEVIQRENPNGQWDSWILGGRWCNFFKIKEGHTGIKGQILSFMKNTDNDPGYADQARKGSIDFETPRNEIAIIAGSRWDAAHKIINNRTWKTIETLKLENETPENLLSLYHDQPVIKDLHANEMFRWNGHDELLLDHDELLLDRDEYIQTQQNKVYVTYAVIKDNKWYEYGINGWWSDTTPIDEKEWNQKFWEMLRDLPDDTLLSLVDCHS
jgi:hypothetical protein